MENLEEELTNSPNGQDLTPPPVFLERAIQDYLSLNLHVLGLGSLRLIATEYSVGFGRIDILAKGRNGTYYAIELKRGVAGREAVAQVQSYMGALRKSFPQSPIFGVIVAKGLDAAAEAALSVTQDVRFSKFAARIVIDVDPLGEEDVPGNNIFRRWIDPVAVTALQVERSGYLARWLPMGGVQADGDVDCVRCTDRLPVVVVGPNLLCAKCGFSVHQANLTSLKNIGRDESNDRYFLPEQCLTERLTSDEAIDIVGSGPANMLLALARVGDELWSYNGRGCENYGELASSAGVVLVREGALVAHKVSVVF